MSAQLMTALWRDIATRLTWMPPGTVVRWDATEGAIFTLPEGFFPVPPVRIDLDLDFMREP